MLNQEEEQTLTALVHTLQQACFSKRTEQPDFNPLKNWLVAKQKQQGKCSAAVHPRYRRYNLGFDRRLTISCPRGIAC